MAEQNLSTLPPITDTSDMSGQTGQLQIPNVPEALVGPSTKEVMIGAGVFLVLTIVFFFIRNAFVNYMIGPSMKRSPNNAGMAGWGLFGGLLFAGALGCAALVSMTYITMLLVILLASLSLICFVVAVVVSSKK
mgnify:FL=1